MTKNAVRYQFMPWTPEGKAEREAQQIRELQQRDETDRQRRADEAENRLDAAVTRRELLAALERVRNDAGCNVGDHWGAIYAILNALHTELE